MGFLKSTISQHGPVLEPCQFGVPAVIRQRSRPTVLRCRLNGDRHFPYGVCYHLKRHRTLVSRRVMVDAIEGTELRASRQPVDGKSIRVPSSGTSDDLCRSHVHSTGGAGCLLWRNCLRRTEGHTRSLCFYGRSPRKLFRGSINGHLHVCVSLGSCSAPVWSKWNWLTREVTVPRVLRLLGPLERQIVMNILWLDASIPAPTMSSWVVREGKKSVPQIISLENPSNMNTPDSMNKPS